MVGNDTKVLPQTCAPAVPSPSLIPRKRHTRTPGAYLTVLRGYSLRSYPSDLSLFDDTKNPISFDQTISTHSAEPPFLFRYALALVSRTAILASAHDFPLGTFAALLGRSYALRLDV